MWMFGLSIRLYLPIAMREIFINLILFPVVFIPLFLDFVVGLLIKRNIKFTYYRIALIFICMPTFVCISFFGAFVKLDNPIIYSYTPYLNYHLIIAYCIVSISISAYSLGRVTIRRRGDERIRSFLMLIGLVFALSVSILCVYILPLRGSFLAAYSALGLLPFAVLWAVAILHYDAFKIRELVLEGESLPLLSRLFSFAVLKLYRLMDGDRYEIKLLLSKTHVASNIINKHYDLAVKHPTLEGKERVKIVASIYRRRIQ